MARLAVGISIITVFLLAALGTTRGTELYWTPAHELAPQCGGCPAACDLDADGDQDVSFLGELESWHFWNIGTPLVPAWQIDTEVLPALPGCWYRAGTYGDVDADGDFDLVSGCLLPGLHMHRNVGTPQAPEWEYDPEPMQGVSTWSYAAPCLADLDADGDLDLVILYEGPDEAYLKRNIGTPQMPQWTPQGSLIPGVTLYNSISLGDLDLDGDLDIVGIAWSGSVGCWENVGTPQAWAFIENPAMLTGVDPPYTYYRRAALLDIDGDADLDLLIVAPDAQVFLYLNEGVSAVQWRSWGTIKAVYR